MIISGSCCFPAEMLKQEYNEESCSSTPPCRPDHLLQNLVYQFVPSLVEKEEAMRKEFKEIFGRDPQEPASYSARKRVLSSTNPPLSRNPSSYTAPDTPQQSTANQDELLAERRQTRSAATTQDDQIVFKLQMDDKLDFTSSFFFFLLFLTDLLFFSFYSSES